MSKYTELKARIDRLNNGWDKECDDILQEIRESTENHRYICISDSNCTKGEGTAYIYIYRGNGEFDEQLAKFPFNSQCQKMTAFKKALMWLLDNSSIKKDDKQDKIDALTEKLEDIQEQLEGLKED